MSIIDKQRIAAVATLESLGYKFSIADGWTANGASRASLSTAEADALHALLVVRADALEGCIEGSEEEAELKAIVDAVKAYGATRWPNGKAPGGKG